MADRLVRTQTAGKPKLLDQRVKAAHAQGWYPSWWILFLCFGRYAVTGLIYYSSNLRRRLRQHSKGSSSAMSYCCPWHHGFFLVHGNEVGIGLIAVCKTL